MKRFIRSSVVKKADNFKPFYTIITVNGETIDKYGNYLIDNDEEDKEFLINKFNNKQDAQKFINKYDNYKNDKNADKMIIKYINNKKEYIDLINN